MTTLVFPENRFGSTRASPTPSLREWLSDRWAVLFSHPGDFDQEQLERDRWLSVLGRTFSEHEVRPMALARCEYEARAASVGWLAELGDGCAAAILSTAAPPQGALLDFRARALRARIARSGARFAMIIDSDLGCRRMMQYRAAVDLPSPIELVGWAVVLRDRQGLIHPFAERMTRADFSCSRGAQRGGNRYTGCSKRGHQPGDQADAECPADAQQSQ